MILPFIHILLPKTTMRFKKQSKYKNKQIKNWKKLFLKLEVRQHSTVLAATVYIWQSDTDLLMSVGWPLFRQVMRLANILSWFFLHDGYFCHAAHHIYDIDAICNVWCDLLEGFSVIIIAASERPDVDILTNQTQVCHLMCEGFEIEWDCHPVGTHDRAGANVTNRFTGWYLATSIMDVCL